MHPTRIIAGALAASLSMLPPLWQQQTGVRADVAVSPISGSADDPRRHFRLRNPARVEGAEAQRLYDILRPAMSRGYASAGMREVRGYQRWTRINRVPYLSKVHGNHYLNNYANRPALSYRRYPDHGTMEPGAVLAKDSFSITETGELVLGPLVVMVKMPPGFNDLSGDWKYILIQPDGTLLGETNGANSHRVRYCIGCHRTMQENDHLYFVPGNVR